MDSNFFGEGGGLGGTRLGGDDVNVKRSGRFVPPDKLHLLGGEPLPYSFTLFLTLSSLIIMSFNEILFGHSSKMFLPFSFVKRIKIT
jgi:hypothetical protein